ncbi:MAG TPA: pyridoxine 5'-phosphate synthase [Polyangiaceae bacterium]|nr:pyridoxine 5'-phosphate synthase [Polyangiaceae bacterium]
MVRLSVNVNKVATVRNSRGGRVPSVLDAARVCVRAGAGGITVHPREDERHIRHSDVRELAEAFAGQWGPALEYNIEGDPRPRWLDLVVAVKPAQATLVPVTPGEVTSNAGWRPGRDDALVAPALERLHDAGIRVSLFVDPDATAIEWAKARGADRIELYTEPFAREFERGPEAARRSFDAYAEAAGVAHSLGLGVNAGHDLDLDNLPLFRALPHLDEVSIGHAIVSRAIFVGLDRVVREYLDVLSGSATA